LRYDRGETGCDNQTPYEETKDYQWPKSQGLLLSGEMIDCPPPIFLKEVPPFDAEKHIDDHAKPEEQAQKIGWHGVVSVCLFYISFADVDSASLNSSVSGSDHRGSTGANLLKEQTLKTVRCKALLPRVGFQVPTARTPIGPNLHLFLALRLGPAPEALLRSTLDPFTYAHAPVGLVRDEPFLHRSMTLRAAEFLLLHRPS